MQQDDLNEIDEKEMKHPMMNPEVNSRRCVRVALSYRK